MADITLPNIDDTDWGAPLNTAINAINDEQETGRLSSATLKYEEGTDIYNHHASQLNRWRAARASASTGGHERIAAIGDSFEEGRFNSVGSDSWPRQMGRLLALSGVPIAGTGWCPPYDDAGPLNYDPRITLSSSVSSAWYGDMKANGAAMLTDSSSSIVFESDLEGTIISVLYRPSGTGTVSFAVKVDSGSAQTVTPSGTGLAVYELDNLDSAKHTVTITTTTGSIDICAIECRAATGLSIDNWGFGASMASDFVYALGGSSPIDAYASTVLYTDPSLLIYGWGGNESGSNGNETTAEYATALDTINTFFPDADQVIRVPTPFDGAGGTSAQVQPYLDVLYALADSADLPLVDMHKRWQSGVLQATYGMISSQPHPSTEGYHDYAVAIATLLNR